MARRKRKRHVTTQVGIRDGQPVLLKLCSDCGEVRPVDDFWIHARWPDGSVRTWSPYCGCHMAERARKRRAGRKHARVRAGRRKRHAERMAHDPAYREAKRKRNRKAAERYLSDPEKAERARQASVRYHRQQRAERREEVNEEGRMYYRLRKERRGEPVLERRTVIDGTGTRAVLPAEPFRLWLERFQAAHGAPGIPDLARMLRVEERRVRDVLGRKQLRVSVDVVERALTTALAINGSVDRLDDLYADEQVILKATTRTRSKTGGRR